MKNVMLKIVGSQINKDSEIEQIELMTEGKMYQRGGATYLVYDESELSGLEGCKTTVKMKGDEVKMRRFGEGATIGTSLEFHKGKRFESYYDTPFGPLEVEILTNELNNNVTFESGGNLDIDYSISLRGLLDGRNRISISVTQEGEEALDDNGLFQ